MEVDESSFFSFFFFFFFVSILSHYFSFWLHSNIHGGIGIKSLVSSLIFLLFSDLERVHFASVYMVLWQCAILLGLKCFIIWFVDIILFHLLGEEHCL